MGVAHLLTEAATETLIFITARIFATPQRMKLILILSIVSQLGLAVRAYAVSPWAVVEPERVKYAIAIAEFSWDELERAFDVVSLGPGAVRLGPVEDRDANAVRRLGRLLNDQDGYVLALIPLLDAAEAPPFAGVVLNRHRQIVANFALRYQSTFHKEASKQLIWNYRTAARYADLDGWVYRLMTKAARLAHSNEREPPPRIELNRGQSRAFGELIEESQTLVGTFTGDRPRPLWTFNDGGLAAALRPEDIDRFMRLTAQNPGARVVLRHRDGTLHDFCEGKLR